jgi:hypothetical protein
MFSLYIAIPEVVLATVEFDSCATYSVICEEANKLLSIVSILVSPTARIAVKGATK